MEPNQRRPIAETNRRIAAVALDGAFTLEMATKAGICPRAVQRRADSGQLERVCRGVYRAAGAPQTLTFLQRAALLASGSRALGIWSASHAHGCVHRPKLVHVVVQSGWSVDGPEWMKAHRLRDLEDDEIVELWDIPVCTMARAIRDYAAVLPRVAWADKQIQKLTEEALMLGRLALDDLAVMYDRERGSATKRRLDALISYESGRDTADLKSEGEVWLRDLVVRRGWPMPQFNAAVPGTNYSGDALWIEHNFLIEFDGFQFHHTREKHDRDRRRDRIVRRGGIDTMRITSTDFRDHRDELEGDIAAALRLA